jgi:NADH dehydrogenase
LDYLIFRPSIVIGKEQKLFEDLKRFIFLPLLVVPKIRVQPIHVLDLAEIILKGVEDKNFKNQICNVGGPRVIPMKELFHLGFQYLAQNLNLPKLGKYLVSKKLIVELPPKYFEPLLPILERLDIMDREQLLMTYTENICPNDNCAPQLLPRLRDISEFFKPKKEN